MSFGISESFLNEMLDAGGDNDLTFNSAANLFSSQDLAELQEPLLTYTPSPEPNDNKSFQQYMTGMHNVFNTNPLAVQMPPSPPADSMTPCDVDYPGELDFNIDIHGPTNGSSKTAGLYSEDLHKVFINMTQSMTVNFKWHDISDNLYIRAMMLFIDPKDSASPVVRCPSHATFASNLNTAHIRHHVLRCQNNNAQYFGDIDSEQHLSVLVPLGVPQAGADSVRVNYEFACKSSCGGGMNRRSVQCIFTLENQSGQVLGRRKVSVRICSCPKRDKDKEEAEKKGTLLKAPQGKRKMVEQSHGHNINAKRSKIVEPQTINEAEYSRSDLISFSDIPVQMESNMEMLPVLKHIYGIMTTKIKFHGSDHYASQLLAMEKLILDCSKVVPNAI